MIYVKSNSKATIHLFSDDSKLFFSSKSIEFFIITDEPINKLKVGIGHWWFHGKYCKKIVFLSFSFIILMKYQISATVLTDQKLKLVIRAVKSFYNYHNILNMRANNFLNLGKFKWKLSTEDRPSCMYAGNLSHQEEHRYQ